MISTPKPKADRGDIGDMVDTAQSWSVLFFLTFSYSLAYVDRQMLNLLVDPIKRSLVISDTEFSFIQGSAFVSAYLIATPIFGRIVDLTNRRNILIFGVCTWSICTALCGMANTYPELFFARFGVGVSEASVLPVAWSLLGDYFSAKRLPRAMSIFAIGTQLGGGFSLVAGGAVVAFAAILSFHIPSLASFKPWQMAFIVIGLPGLLLALALLLFMREPARLKALNRTVAAKPPAMKEVGQMLWGRRSFYARMYLSIGMIGIVQLGVPAWFPSFMIRAHGLSASATGYRLGVLSVIFGSAGVLLGPVIAQWSKNRGYVDTTVKMAAFATIGMLIFCAAIPIAPGNVGAFTAGAGVLFFCCLPVAVISSAIQLATPANMRGVIGSVYTFTAQILGYAVGPTSVALITDKGFHDPKMVGYSLQIVTCTASLIAMILLFTVLKHHRKILAETPAAQPAKITNMDPALSASIQEA